MAFPTGLRRIVCGCILLVVGCQAPPEDVDVPDHDPGPIIKAQLNALSEALRTDSDSALRPLISAEGARFGVADSLSRLIADTLISFDHFGDCEFVYTDEFARFDCFVVGPTDTGSTLITLTLRMQPDSSWLLDRVETGVRPLTRPDDGINIDSLVEAELQPPTGD